MKTNSYMTRALQSRDPRYARVLARLGYRSKDAAAVEEKVHPLDHDGDGHPGGSVSPPPSEDLTALRATYFEVVGKRPFNGWDAATLREKIAAAETN